MSCSAIAVSATWHYKFGLQGRLTLPMAEPGPRVMDDRERPDDLGRGIVSAVPVANRRRSPVAAGFGGLLSLRPWPPPAQSTPTQLPAAPVGTRIASMSLGEPDVTLQPYIPA